MATPELNIRLAEFLGLLIGDGYLDKKRGRVIISGNLSTDSEYLKSHVRRLIENLFKVKCISWKQENKNCYYLCFYSKKTLDQLLTLSINKEKIPNVIMQSNIKIKAAFIRGLADTDFTIYFKKGKTRKNYSYPIIASTFSSKTLVLQTKKLLADFGIRANIYDHTTKYGDKIYKQHDIQIYGKKNLEVWLNKIGFSNPRINKRIELWQKQGFCIPHSY